MIHCDICGCALDDYEMLIGMKICTTCDEPWDGEEWDDDEFDDT